MSGVSRLTFLALGGGEGDEDGMLIEVGGGVTVMRKEAVYTLLLNATLFRGMRCFLAQDPRYLRFSVFEAGATTHYNLRVRPFSPSPSPSPSPSLASSGSRAHLGGLGRFRTRRSRRSSSRRSVRTSLPSRSASSSDKLGVSPSAGSTTTSIDEERRGRGGRVRW